MKSLFEKLKQQKWSIVETNEPVSWPKEISQRFKGIPREADFLLSLKEFVAPDEKSWFLCSEDYYGTSESEFKWNEFETESLEAAKGDLDWQKEIIKFWDKHFPIYISVENGYSYYAISLEEDTYGKIVRGGDPEYEETEIVSNSFQTLLEEKIKN